MIKKTLALVLIAVILAVAACKKECPPPPPTPVKPHFYVGADLSFQSEISDEQLQYFDSAANPIDILPFLKSKGVNLIRIRIWHTPATKYSSLEDVKEYALLIKQNEMDFLLDFHYSDHWADPGQQTPPAAWADADLADLKDSIYHYTLDVLKELKEQGTMPEIVQVGNETNSGFLWDQGRVGGNFDQNWPDYAALTTRAIDAIRESDPGIIIMMHFAGTQGATWYFDHIQQYQLDYDMIGLSYYSIWHGKDFNKLRLDLNELADTYQKPVMVVETFYPWTLDWNDWTNNFYGEESQLIPGYPATPEGQAAYLADLISFIKDIPGDLGTGYCWWAPDWVAYKGPEASNGSPIENTTWFDFNNKALPVLEALGK